MVGPVSASAAQKTVVMHSQPFRMGPFETQKPKVIVRAPRSNGYITRMFARVVDRRGRPVSIRSVMLHHVVFINRGRFAGDRKSHCGVRFGEPFYGTGEERQSLRLPAGYGYRIRTGDKWKMQTMLMSHQLRSQSVRVEYRMRIVTARRLAAVTPYWVRVTNCRNAPSYTIPGGGAPGSIHRRTNSWTVPQDGRIVAGGAHLHGGSHDLELTQPSCGGRRLFHSVPSYAPPDDVVYDVRPALHEPGPFNTGWFLSSRGIPVHRGESLSLTAFYDAEHPHPGVMGVMHVYIARPRTRAAKCATLPTDARVLRIAGPKRDEPPRVRVPLTTLNARGQPITLAHPPGRVFHYADPDARPIVNVSGVFSKPNLSIAHGTAVTWRFTDVRPHKVSTANGPRAFGSATLSAGHQYTRRFNVPGTYQLFCYLHPITMHQEVVVRPTRVAAASSHRDATGSADVEDDFY